MLKTILDVIKTENGIEIINIKKEKIKIIHPKKEIDVFKEKFLMSFKIVG